MAKILFFSAVLLMLTGVSGCASFQFAPPQSFDTDADIQALEAQFGTSSSITGYYSGSQTPARRNEFITGRLALINLQYVLFIREFAADKAQLDTAMDMLQLGVDLATTVVGGAATKAALGAASGGITGTRASVKKNFFFEQTVPALMTAMNAQRKQALIPIIKGLKSPLPDYPFAQGVTDLEAYYFAGTFVGGLQAIQKDAGQKEGKADKTIERLTSTFVKTPTGDGLRAFWKPDGTNIHPENETRLKNWMQDNDISVSIFSFLRGSQFEAKRAKAVHDLGL